MRIEKQMLNDALRVLGKAVYQTSPVELYRSVRFVGVPGNVRAMVTDGVEVVSVKVESDNVEPVDFCVEFKVLRELVRVAKDHELQGKFIEALEMVPVPDDAVTTVLPAEVSKYLELAAPIINKAEYRRVLQGINLSPYGVTVTDGKQMLCDSCTGLNVVHAHHVVTAMLRKRHNIAIEKNDRNLLSLEHFEHDRVYHIAEIPRHRLVNDPRKTVVGKLFRKSAHLCRPLFAYVASHLAKSQLIARLVGKTVYLADDRFEKISDRNARHYQSDFAGYSLLRNERA